MSVETTFEMLQHYKSVNIQNLNNQGSHGFPDGLLLYLQVKYVSM